MFNEAHLLPDVTQWHDPKTKTTLRFSPQGNVLTLYPPDSQQSHMVDVDSLQQARATVFFYEHAPSSHDPETETPEHGRLKGALKLARAESEDE